MNSKLNIIKPTDKRTALKRLPVHKTAVLNFPIRPNPEVNKIYIEDRKINIINSKNFKNLYKGFRKE